MANSSAQTRFWAVLALFLFGAIWLLKPILLPFVAGGVIAYFLDPLVNRLSARGMPRSFGSLLVLVGFILIVVWALILVVPLVQSQIAALIAALPGYVAALREKFAPRVTEWLATLSPHDVEKLREAASNSVGSAAVWAGDMLKQLVSSGLALFDVAALIVVTPVVAFYLLRDWPAVTRETDSLVPRKNHQFFRQAVDEIDRALSGFLRGQALVCLSLGIIYGVGLTLVGLKYGATIGIIAGFLSFIPYVGSTFVLIASTILALIQFDNFVSILPVFAVFLVGQGLEGYVLTPKLVGDRVGLHPVWILFAIFAGASLFGFVGVLIAVPVAAIVGVLIRLGLTRYRSSALYERRHTPR